MARNDYKADYKNGTMIKLVDHYQLDGNDKEKVKELTDNPKQQECYKHTCSYFKNDYQFSKHNMFQDGPRFVLIR